MKKNVSKLCFAALFTAVITVLSQVAIPFPSGVPITLQTFAVALCGYTLGVKWGLASLLSYTLLGIVGVPVFANFKGGIQVLFGATGGFIFGFFFIVLLCGMSNMLKNNFLKILIGISGLLICHLIGVVQFTFVYKTDFISGALMVSLPYMIKDLFSVVVAFFASVCIKNKLLIKNA